MKNLTHQELREIGLSALYTGKFSEAAAAFLAYIEKEPTHNTIHAYLSEAYYGLNDYEKALAAIDRCIQLEGPSYKHRLELRIKILKSLGRFEAAEHDQKVYDQYCKDTNEQGNDPNYYMYR